MGRKCDPRAVKRHCHLFGERDVSINASTLSGRGLIYAPNGTITINVQNLDFAGSIIAKRIVIQGSVININKNGEK